MSANPKDSGFWEARRLYWGLFGSPALCDAKLKHLGEAFRVGFRVGTGDRSALAGFRSGIEAGRVSMRRRGAV